MSRTGKPGAWLMLAVGSVAAALSLDAAGLPGAWLLAPMLAAVAAAAAGLRAAVPRGASVAAQALIGCLIAHSITPGILATLASDWALFMAITIATILASMALGYLLTRWRVVPGTVAIWGSAPGGATAMVSMAQAWGADARLVAVMAYLRVAMVGGVASIVALAHAGRVPHASVAAAASWSVDPTSLALTAAIAAAGSLLGHLTRVPAGALIWTMGIGAALNLSDVAAVDPPRALMIPVYLVVGWRVGLAFTRETLLATARALPRLALASALLLGFCGAMAWVLVRFAGFDPLSAYLATSPGGMDAVAVIASTSGADISCVMALQVVRFLMVMAVAPVLATWLAARHSAGPAP